MELNRLETRVLDLLQRGIPLQPRPFARLGDTLGVPAQTVVDTVAALIEKGAVRRFGAVFDSRSLGYASTLCAVDVPPERMDAAVAVLTPHPGVTHCYEREGQPNLWFTMTARADRLELELDAFAKKLQPLRILNLPALRRFKIDVVFDLQNRRRAPAHPDAAAPHPVAPRHGDGTLTPRERALVRRLQESIPLKESLFEALAAETGYGVDELLRLLNEWKAAGLVRRIGLIARHRRLGFDANAMCVWDVAPEHIESAGRALATCAEVTHCYERPRTESVPFNLYAMIHARTREEAANTLRRISDAAALRDGRMLISRREFKKSSPLFFRETDTHRGTADAAGRPRP